MPALVLSLVGIVVGAFLVINVTGQLVQLCPEQRPGRALVPMGLGASIAAAMIRFNRKRETIMQRIRIVQVDPAGRE